VNVPAIRAVEAAFHGAKKPNMVAFLEPACNLSRAPANDCTSGFVSNRYGILAKDETLVVGLEEHDVGVAERSVLDLHKELMLARFWHRNLIQMQLVVALIISVHYQQP
jgi:hypothetical protein